MGRVDPVLSQNYQGSSISAQSAVECTGIDKIRGELSAVYCFTSLLHAPPPHQATTILGKVVRYCYKKPHHKGAIRGDIIINLLL